MKIRSGQRSKLPWLLGAFLIVTGGVLFGCQKPAQMHITGGNPPVIKLSGDPYFDWLTVSGPLPEKMDDPRPSLIWKIAPVGRPPRLKEIPPIVYGQVPPGLTQEEPKTQQPPALVEGNVYSISVVTRSDHHPSVTIVIRNGKAVELRPEDVQIPNNNVSSYVPQAVSGLKSCGHIYFVPMSYSDSGLKELAAYYRTKYSLQIEIEPDLDIPFSSTYDIQRGQSVAEVFVAALKQNYPEKGNEDALYIGFEADDMYSRNEPWRYVYYYTQGRYAVVSDGRFAAFSDSKELSKLRKMVTRTIGILCYHLPLSDDPRSVMYKGLRGPDDLDRMSEDF